MTASDRERLVWLLEVAQREGRHLLATTERLLQEDIDADWVRRLDSEPILAERVDAFVARFGRFQDHLGNKLVPSLFGVMLEPAAAMLDNLNRLEKLRLLSSVMDWVEARNLRNRLVHEYMQDPSEFAQGLVRALHLVGLLLRTYNAVNRYIRDRFGGGKDVWPSLLPDEPRPTTP
ncbi:MAG: hypothetical protein K9M02_19075 [Thiohalocapsa sp.]|nr:hypothetical protein [Thiohalocapsa sp.]